MRTAWVRLLGPGAGLVVLRDHAAQGEAAEGVHVFQRRFQVGAADVFKIDVDAVRAQAADLVDQRGHVLVVQGLVDAGDVAQPLHLGRRAGAAHHAAAFDLGDLADDHADGAGGPRYEHRFAFARLADVKQADVGRQARHAHGAEVGLQGHAFAVRPW